MAEKLLAKDPNLCDAWIAVGVENYMLSIKPAPVRWVLRLTGAQTDRGVGIEKLKLAAEKGHYLAPFARLMLAVVALRDSDPTRARELLSGLARIPRPNALSTMQMLPMDGSNCAIMPNGSSLRLPGILHPICCKAQQLYSPEHPTS